MDQIIGYFAHATSIQIYGMIFIFLLAGAFAFPFPEEITFLSIGYAAYKGWIDPRVGAVVGLLSLVVGDSVIYFLGKWLGLKIFSLPVLRNIVTRKAIDKGHSLVNRHGSKIVFFSKFVVGLRYSVFFASGMLEIGYVRFLTFDMLASFITVPLLVSTAYLNGRHIHRVLETVKRVNRGILIAVVVVLFILVVAGYLKNRRDRKRHH